MKKQELSTVLSTVAFLAAAVYAIKTKPKSIWIWLFLLVVVPGSFGSIGYAIGKDDTTTGTNTNADNSVDPYGKKKRV